MGKANFDIKWSLLTPINPNLLCMAEGCGETALHQRLWEFHDPGRARHYSWLCGHHRDEVLGLVKVSRETE